MMSAPDHPDKGIDVGSVIGSAVHGAWTGLWQSPVVGIVISLLVVAALVRSARNAIHGGHPKDAVRLFSSADKRVILSRAGNRCEHHFPLFGRCTTTTGLQADHVHPHSRGGWTSLSNAQALCPQHNREKSARVPWNWQLNRMTKRRAAYFEDGHDPVVVRRAPKSTRV